ncbi:unnamed protein product, partial [Trichogramma brassicae]
MSVVKLGGLGSRISNLFYFQGLVECLCHSSLDSTRRTILALMCLSLQENFRFHGGRARTSLNA